MIKSQKIALTVTVVSVLLACSFYNISQSINLPFSSSEEIPSSVYQLYSKWNMKYGNLRMAPNEDNFRLRQFNKSYQIVQRLRQTQPTADFSLNSFATVTDEEFRQNFLNQKDLEENKKEDSELPKMLQAVSPEDLTLSNVIPTLLDKLSKLTKPSKKQIKKQQKKDDKKETQIDYMAQRKLPVPILMKKYYVPNQRRVMNQGKCGSCYAFSTKHNLEDVLRGTTEISAQHIIQCSREDSKDKNGCHGGSQEDSLRQILDIGYRLDSEMPYSMKKGPCLKDGNMKFSDNLMYQTQYFKTNSEIKSAILKYRRGISFGIKTSKAFKFYSGGIFDSENIENQCTESPGHAVYLSGWGESYWRVKNSWGDDYGIKGYVHVKMNDDLIGEKSICICGKRKKIDSKLGCKFQTVVKRP